MKKIKNIIFAGFALIFGLTLIGCVSSSKYQAALDDLARMKMDSTIQANKIADAEYEKSKELTEANEIIRASKEELENLRAIAKERKELLDNITNQLHAAIPVINNQNLETYTDDNFLHIQLPHRVLFNSGESRLTNDGSKVIQQIATTLKNVDSDIMILGHADTVPYVSSARNNWDLSLDRAQVVMESMIDNGISAEKLIIAGRGNQEPFMKNESQIGRLLSRRIEIVVMPDMSKMESLMEQVSQNNSDQ